MNWNFSDCACHVDVDWVFAKVSVPRPVELMEHARYTGVTGFDRAFQNEWDRRRATAHRERGRLVV